MCNCIREIPKGLEKSEKIYQIAKDKTGQQYIKDSANIKDVSFSLSGQPTKTYSEIEYSVKNRKRKYKIVMLHNYCPWCGRPYNKKKNIIKEVFEWIKKITTKKNSIN